MSKAIKVIVDSNFPQNCRAKLYDTDFPDDVESIVDLPSVSKITWHVEAGGRPPSAMITFENIRIETP